MKRQRLVLLAVAAVAAGAAGCFKDPVSSLRNGPSAFSLDHNNVILRTGDSVSVTAYLEDAGGNQLPVSGVTWASGNPALAVVRNDTTLPIPGNAFARGVIRAVDSVSGGWTDVTVSSRGVTDTIRVVVVPARLVAAYFLTAGPTLTDTVIQPANPLIPGDTTKYLQYTAKDTLIINGSTLMKFDTSKVAVSVSTAGGSSKGLVVAKTPSQIKVVFMTGTVGQVMVQHLLFTPGNTAVGTINVDTLISTNSVQVAPWRIGPSVFGGGASVTSNIMTVTAGVNLSFGSTTGARLSGGVPATIVGQTASTLTLFSPVNYAGPVTVTNVQMTGGANVPSVTFDSISTNTGNFSFTAVNLPTANVNLNGGQLGDTIVVTAPSGMAFSTGTAPSQTLLGNRDIDESDTAWILSATPGTLKIFAKRGGKSRITVTALGLATPPPGPLPFDLTTPDSLAIDSTASAFVGGTTKATARLTTIPASNVDTTYGYAWCPDNDASGSCYGTTAVLGFTTFTLSATHTVAVEMGWFGSGNPYSASGTNDLPYTADLDAQLCDATQACDESQGDLDGGAMETASQPEKGTSTSPLAPGQYWIGVIPWTGPYAVVYRLIITLQ